MKKTLFIAALFAGAVFFYGCETTGAEVKTEEKTGVSAIENEAELAIDQQEQEAVKVLNENGEQVKEVEAIPAAESAAEEESAAAEDDNKDLQAEVDSAGGTETAQSAEETKLPADAESDTGNAEAEPSAK